MTQTAPNAVARLQRLALAVVCCNFLLWQLGIVFIMFGGFLDPFGMTFCSVAMPIAYLLVPVAVVYSIVLRYLSSHRVWNAWVPITALLSFVIMTWQWEAALHL